MDCDWGDLFEAEDGTGASLWPGGAVLAELVADGSARRVLEFGCGVGGAPGLAAARAGAEVVLSDGSTWVVEELQKRSIGVGFRAGVSVRALDWEDDKAVASILAEWPEGFDQLLAAEVLLRSEVNSELNFPPNFEGLVLGCIDADFCK